MDFIRFFSPPFSMVSSLKVFNTDRISRQFAKCTTNDKHSNFSLAEFAPSSPLFTGNIRVSSARLFSIPNCITGCIDESALPGFIILIERLIFFRERDWIRFFVFIFRDNWLEFLNIGIQDTSISEINTGIKIWGIAWMWMRKSSAWYIM